MIADRKTDLQTKIKNNKLVRMWMNLDKHSLYKIMTY